MKACDQTSWQNPQWLDTLAAAYAETGDFAQAIKWEKKAADATGSPRMRARLSLFQPQQPFHDR
jgi:serine/threonine-protein kinase